MHGLCEYSDSCTSHFRYTEPDFLYIRSWLPCIFFSGGVTMGNIGRQLAVVSYLVLPLSWLHWNVACSN